MKTCHSQQRRYKQRAERRPGFALLLCLFIIFMLSTWVVGMLSSQTVHFAALRNNIEFEQALYLANAGVHHAAVQVEADTTWRGTVSAGSYPSSGSYSATAADGSTGTVVITSTGVSGGVTRKLQATISVP